MRLRSLVWWLVSAIGVGAVFSGFFIVRRGLSARNEPSTVEVFIARTMRSLAVPRRTRNLANPVPLTDKALADARAHFADHCATCHANDGSGNTPIGRNLYPKAPDMRLPATQNLTDGELYSIIQDGIRLTGMPAWGKAGDDSDEDSWKLVHLIRHLKELTLEQVDEMKRINPKSPADIEEERQEDNFLRGIGDAATNESKKPEGPHHKH